MNLSVTKRFAYGSAAIFLFLVSLPVLAAAGAKIKIDDTKFFQIGMGYRGSLRRMPRQVERIIHLIRRQKI